MKNVINAFVLSVLVGSLFFASCTAEPDKGKPAKAKITPSISFEYVRDYPHSTNAFTEGLLFHDKQLFESTGSPQNMYLTKSVFGIVNLETGEIDVKGELSDNLFGEGIVILNDKLYQLTYKAKRGFVYAMNSFEKIGEFTIPSYEGWGFTTDSTSLIMSDGSATLTYLNPLTLEVEKQLEVTESGYSKDRLNELEYAKGFIYANVWGTSSIVKINPANGEVVGAMNLNMLFEEARSLDENALEMNGIAFNPISNTFYITGKMWPKLYELKVNL